MKTLKSVPYLLSFTIPLAKSLQYASHGGFSPFERIENVTGIEALFTARHSGQMRQIIQTLVCGENQENCAHSAGKFYKALKNYGCNCYPDNYIKTDLDTTGTFSHMGANGASLDWIDRACLRVHDAYSAFRNLCSTAEIWSFLKFLAKKFTPKTSKMTKFRRRTQIFERTVQVHDPGLQFRNNLTNY